MVSTLQNLFLDIQGDNQGTKPGGEPIHRIVTLHNRGDRVAYLQLWVEATEQRSANIVQWVTFDRPESELTLDPHESVDVTLTITVPLQAEAGFYGYAIRMQSSQYPGEDVRRNQQLHILPSDQEARLRNEPRLTVIPATDADHPHLLKPGATLSINLTVENPSRRTDRFFLHCDHLPTDWRTIQYPESEAAVPGVVTFTDGLQLNPRESGQITMTIHPPQYSAAGSYYPTLRLTSKASPDITLLKVVYFTLETDESLAIELTPKALSIPRGNRSFDIAVHNQGNIERQLAFQGWDLDQRLHYRLQPDAVRLIPGKQTHLRLLVDPRHWWQKLWRLRDRTIEFDLLVENVSTQGDETSALPHPLPTGTVHLKAQRRWLFWLLLLSTATTALLGLLALVWHLFVWRPSLVPKITAFSTTKDSYQEGKSESIAFSWEITNPGKVEQLVLMKGSDRIMELSHLLGESDSIVVPRMLEEKASCSLENTISKNSPLIVLLRIYRRASKLTPDPQYLKCRAVIPGNFPPKDAVLSNAAIAALDSIKRPVEGTHEFQLQVYTKAKSQDSKTNDKIEKEEGDEKEQEDKQSQNSEAGTAVDAGIDAANDNEGEQNNATESEGIFSRLKQILGLEDSKELQLADKQILENVVVTAPDPPEILQFEATRSEYRTVSQLVVAAETVKDNTDVASASSSLSSVGSATNVVAANNNIAPNSTPNAISSQTNSGGLSDPEIVDPEVIPVKLSWQITNPQDIRELRLVSLSPDGSENTKAITYPLVENKGKLDLLALKDFCEIPPPAADTAGGPDILQCEDVPTQATEVGDYVFYLTVVTRDGIEETPILETTPTISIKPLAPDIVKFTVNGDSVETKPRHVYVLNPARGKIDVTLTWDVQHAKQVELLPAPGQVINNGDITYTLSAAPGAETITIRGVNELDEEVTQSVIIEKVAFVADAQPIPIQSSRRSSQPAPPLTNDGLQSPPPPPTVLPVPDLAPIRTPPQGH